MAHPNNFQVTYSLVFPLRYVASKSHWNLLHSFLLFFFLFFWFVICEMDMKKHFHVQIRICLVGKHYFILFIFIDVLLASNAQRYIFAIWRPKHKNNLDIVPEIRLSYLSGLLSCSFMITDQTFFSFGY